MEGLQVRPAGIYVDATFGGGGHAQELLKKLTTGHLYAFDQDEEAAKNAIKDARFTLIRENFRDLKEALEERKVTAVDGLLADLGVSSYQFDTAARGFSTRFDAALDMRMSREIKLTAATIINEYEEEGLKKIFRQYGELEQASRIAKEIVSGRKNKAIETVDELKKAVKHLAKKGKENQFYAQLFQALRIEVNDELEALKELLRQCEEVIMKGGRLVIISYHSLEDRIVKNFMRSGKFDGDAEKDVFGNVLAPFKPVNRKPVEPSEEEIKNNARSRSAKLRIAEKN